MRHQTQPNALQALQLRIARRRQRAFRPGVKQQLGVFLNGGVFKLLGRYQVAQAGGLADVNLRQQRRGGQRGRAADSGQ